MKFFLMAVAFCLLFCRLAFASVFYVDKDGIGGACNDTNSGTTTAAPWCTIAKANNMVRPGDVINIRAGVYDEVIAPKRSGTSGRSIVYRSFPVNVSNKVIIRGRPGVYLVVNIGGLGTDWQPKSYVVIDGLTIKRGFPEKLGNARHSLISIYGPKSSHNIIRNCTLIGTEKALLPVWNHNDGLRVGGISISRSSYDLIENNTIRNMTFMGIVLGGMPRPRFTIIRNNHIENIVQDGIHIGTKGEDDTILGLLVEGNDIHGSLISDGIEANGCYAAKASADCTGVAGVIVRNNRIYNNAENNLDLKGTRYWLIENNILYGSSGNNNGGTKRRSQDHCYVLPCDNLAGGSGGITKGGNRYSRDIIIRRNVVYDNLAGIIVWDNYIIYNNTIVNNRRSFHGSDQKFCVMDNCSRKPQFPGLYGGGKHAVIINNIIGDNGFAISRWRTPEWLIDNNLYYWPRKEQFRGLAQFYGKWKWQAFSLIGWQNYLKTRAEVYGKDAHSIVATVPQDLFSKVNLPPVGDYGQFDFSLSAHSAAIDAGRQLTTTVGSGDGALIHVKDARFFCDGYGVTDGDLVVIGKNPPVRINGVNYTTNVLILAKSLAWQKGDSVNLPYKGAAPDIGARETN
ncbi:right-handed parallel beta-helix repeat-containing protein [Desulfobacterota bacterium M19]